MSPKKAAKKSAKKAAKKSAKKAAKHAGKHHGPKETRRAYEHLGRVTILQNLLSGDGLGHVRALAELSHRELEGGMPRNSAELLRAAEHFAFASLSSEHKEDISGDLRDVIAEECERLLERAEEQFESEEDKPSPVSSLYMLAREASSKAMSKSSYHRALEYARAADTLADVKLHLQKNLEVKKPSARLR